MWNPIILDVECIVCNKTLQKINHNPSEASKKMGKIANRRSRTPNWSLQEKQYLLELIKARKEVIVNKSNNGPNHSEEKDVAWNEILRELALKFGNKFTTSCIKKVKTQWQNMRRIAREEISLNGPEVEKLSRQTMDVCDILDLVKDGVLKKYEEQTSFNDSSITTNIEIKTERIDDEVNQPECNGLQNSAETNFIPSQQIDTNQLDSSASSVSEVMSDTNDYEPHEPEPEPDLQNRGNKRNVSAMTEPCQPNDGLPVNPFHREFEEFFRYKDLEKQIKMETLKEERHIVRAMRETAELNKIIAEQKLKHLLWVKRQEIVLNDYDRNNNFKPNNNNLQSDNIKYSIECAENKLYKSVDSKTVIPN